MINNIISTFGCINNKLDWIIAFLKCQNDACEIKLQYNDFKERSYSINANNIYILE